MDRKELKHQVRPEDDREKRAVSAILTVIYRTKQVVWYITVLISNSLCYIIGKERSLLIDKR